ncbi:cAMP-activated global transcriptional regulator CRP [Curvibacter sp. AEP1-3]|uniref:Crp/Fnr family transcriptional regulator n=1 Tax=Curvibacter sp. AEP1-3 TaxID=1844971 RepID=UPI000B3D216E|nr:Crp/Fnr family transcriptional regulator [Curvibacter sp. AEP1-3]ARV20636.1 cAMP-activated global transcriptional regulator CRP [Curvibacter sp. AEP1-3]
MQDTGTFVGGYAYQKLRSLGCTEATAASYATKTSIKSFESGEIIWRKGQTISHWCTIINGLVSCSLIDEEKRDIHVALFNENAWFGEHAILSEKPSFANYRCLVSVDTLQIEAGCIREMLSTELAFATKLAKVLAWRMQRTSEMLMLFRMGNPALRSVIGISQFAEALAYDSDRPSAMEIGSKVSISINQSVLASLCGVSRSRFSSVLHSLENKGWLRLEYGTIEILNLPAWHSFAASKRSLHFINYDPTIDELLDELNVCLFRLRSLA